MAKPNLSNAIKQSESVFVAGKTGTGKTHLAKHYIAGFPSACILDTKGDALIDIAKGKNPFPQVNPKELTIIERFDDIHYVETPYFIYSPIKEELHEDAYNDFFKWCYYKTKITVLVDEAMQVSPNPHSIPIEYKGILTRGRTRDVAVWSCTQRPAGLSKTILSQSVHMFVFRLTLLEDRKRIVDTTACPEMLTNPQGHEFWYWKDGMDNAVKAILKESA